jgi:hypothetical protein
MGADMGWLGGGTASGIFSEGGTIRLGACLAGAGDGRAGGRDVVNRAGMSRRKPKKAKRKTPKKSPTRIRTSEK